MSEPRYSPLAQLTLARLREFFRVPEAIFWVYGFPLLLALALGIAFRERPVERIRIDVIDSPRAESVRAALSEDPRLEVTVGTEEDGRLRLRTTKTDLLLAPTEGGGHEYRFDPNRPESVLARAAADNALMRAARPADAPAATDVTVHEAGSRYIDFLIPGLIGMNLMGGGLFGVGFVIVDMRVRKLLKRFLATPMRKSDFMLSLMLSRMAFAIPEVLLLLAVAWLVFGVTVRGDWLLLFGLIVAGGACFAGLGLLIASRARTLETASGLMNLAMLPMYVLSGVFFSSERFPAWSQPIIQALPLTALNNALRAVMLDGAGVAAILPQLAVMAVWGGVSFVLALWWFRWQ
jgi:ABC-2 type transport system permease protein